MFSNREVAEEYIECLRLQGPIRYSNPYFWSAKLAEEVGEAVKEANRRLGFSRAGYDPEHEAEELADVVISAYAQSIRAGIDLDKAIQRKHAYYTTRNLKGGDPLD
jgi:NTP pyrophosphatase (non-canonical NTP hydrolase)